MSSVSHFFKPLIFYSVSTNSPTHIYLCVPSVEWWMFHAMGVRAQLWAKASRSSDLATRNMAGNHTCALITFVLALTYMNDACKSNTIFWIQLKIKSILPILRFVHPLYLHYCIYFNSKTLSTEAMLLKTIYISKIQCNITGLHTKIESEFQISCEIVYSRHRNYI